MIEPNNVALALIAASLFHYIKKYLNYFFDGARLLSEKEDALAKSFNNLKLMSNVDPDQLKTLRNAIANGEAERGQAKILLEKLESTLTDKEVVDDINSIEEMTGSWTLEDVTSTDGANATYEDTVRAKLVLTKLLELKLMKDSQQ